jgi:hypothetical protein
MIEAVAVDDHAARPLDAGLVELDRRLVATAKNIHILGSLGWPAHTLAEFLEGWMRGEPALPQPPVPKPIAEAQLEELQAVAASERTDPWGAFLVDTAQSYLGACDVILHAGTPRASEAARALYGVPSDPLPGCAMTHREAADQLLEVTGSLVPVTRDVENEYCISPEVVATEMRSAFGSSSGRRLRASRSIRISRPRQRRRRGRSGCARRRASRRTTSGSSSSTRRSCTARPRSTGDRSPT